MENGMRELWMPGARMNMECNERNHKHPSYQQNYTALREADIKKVKGDDVYFHYFNPHAKGFNVFEEAKAIGRIISDRLANKAENVRATTAARVNQDVTKADELKISNDGTANSWTSFIGGHDVLCVPLLNVLKTGIDAKIRYFSTVHERFLHQSAGETGTADVCVDGYTCDIEYGVDKTIDGLLVVDRIDLCRAFTLSPGKLYKYNHVNTYNHWRRRSMLGKPSQGGADASGLLNPRKRKFGLLTTTELMSVFAYYRSTKPEVVDAIRKRFIAKGLLSPFREVTAATKLKEKALRQVLELVNAEYPDARFSKTCMTTKGGAKPFRRLDAWCKKLSLCIGCIGMEGGHSAASKQQREADILRATGGKAQFYYIQPYTVDFDARRDAKAINNLILTIMEGTVADG